MTNWKKIDGFENYEISEEGFVRSRNKILKFRLDKNGYARLNLRQSGLHKTFLIHQLVAKHFLGYSPIPNVISIDHIDDNKLNNHVNNLRIVSVLENTIKSIDKSQTTSKKIGVYFHKKMNKWAVTITRNGKRKWIGAFNNEEDAIKKRIEHENIF